MKKGTADHMTSLYTKSITLIVLAALTMPAMASASVEACIAACASGWMPDDAQCMNSPHETHVAAASGCCEKPAAPTDASKMTGHPDGGCGCPTCRLASSRYVTERAPVKLPPMAKAALAADTIIASVYVPLVRANEARCAQIRTGPTRAQLCVYLR